MAIAALLALFPVLYVFAPRLGLAALAVAILLLVSRRLAAARPGRRTAAARPEPVAWKDPWRTG
jgi:hypothetical protein